MSIGYSGRGPSGHGCNWPETQGFGNYRRRRWVNRRLGKRQQFKLSARDEDSCRSLHECRLLDLRYVSSMYVLATPPAETEAHFRQLLGHATQKRAIRSTSHIAMCLECPTVKTVGRGLRLHITIYPPLLGTPRVFLGDVGKGNARSEGKSCFNVVVLGWGQ